MNKNSLSYSRRSSDERALRRILLFGRTTDAYLNENTFSAGAVCDFDWVPAYAEAISSPSPSFRDKEIASTAIFDFIAMHRVCSGRHLTRLQTACDNFAGHAEKLTTIEW